MEQEKNPLLDLLQSAPDRWQELFQRELEKTNLQGFRQEELARVAQILIGRVNSLYHKKLHTDFNDQDKLTALTDLLEIIVPAPTEWITALTRKIEALRADWLRF